MIAVAALLFSLLAAALHAATLRFYLRYAAMIICLLLRRDAAAVDRRLAQRRQIRYYVAIRYADA